jgi:hypothetical protein
MHHDMMRSITLFFLSSVSFRFTLGPPFATLIYSSRTSALLQRPSAELQHVVLMQTRTAAANIAIATSASGGRIMIVETIGRGRVMTAMTAVGRDYGFYGIDISSHNGNEY